jgi:hypothetical protein
MNSLYTHGVRQTNSLTADLERLRSGDNSASLLGLLNSPAYFRGEGVSVIGKNLRTRLVRTDIRLTRRNAQNH